MLPLDTTAPVPSEHLPIYRLEAELLKLPQVDMPVEHSFCSGLYARTMHLKGGHVYTGAVHRGESFFVVRSGELASYRDGVQTIHRAGDMHVVPDGSKRAVVALTDCVVTTFHANPTGETEPQALWALFTSPAPADVLTHDRRDLIAEAA